MTKTQALSLSITAGVMILVAFFSRDAVGDVITASSDDFTRFDPLFKKYGAKFGVNWKWLKALAWNESDIGRDSSVAAGIQTPWDIQTSASSDHLSWGIMQTQVTTARDYRPGTTEADLNDPEISIEIGAAHFSRLLKVFSNDIQKAVMAYNNGEGNVKKGSLVSLPYFKKFQTHLDAINSRQPD